MKYSKDIPKSDETIRTQYMEKGWHTLKEPPNIGLAFITSLPFMFVFGAINLVLLAYLNPELFDFFNSDTINLTFRVDYLLLIYIVVFCAYMFLHEMLHAALIPGFLHSDKTVWGFKAAFAFVYTSEELSKWRFIAVSLAPYFVLSIIATLVLSALNLVNGYIAFILLANAAGSCVDFLNATLILVQVPHNGKIVLNGNQTYYSGK